MSDEGYGASAAYLRLLEEQHVRELRALIADHNRTCDEGEECETCVAPRLARENLRLRAECDRHQRDAGQWWGELSTANGELLRLRAIIAGRSVAPTPQEIDAHDGGWLVRYVRPRDPKRGERVEFCGVGWRQNARDFAAQCETTWWLPLDRDGCPCAWPVTP